MPFGLPNVSIAQVFRLIQTFAVPLVLAYLVREVTKRFSSDDSQASKINPSLYSPLLQDIGFRADASFPVSFTDNASAYDHFERVSIVPNTSTTGRPDTTAVLLNWARFPNVLLITSMMCSPELGSIIAQVLIWNNTPRPLSYEVCCLAACISARLCSHDMSYTGLQEHGLSAVEIKHSQLLWECSLPRPLPGLLQSGYPVLLCPGECTGSH